MSHLNKTSKDILARAMAQEDITVQHSASAQTAAFDVQNRCLILPVWKDMDNAMYDMLVGHEVSHALHTPAQGWQDFVGNSGMRHMFVNVVEDARIERMIKSKFQAFAGTLLPLMRHFKNATSSKSPVRMFRRLL